MVVMRALLDRDATFWEKKCWGNLDATRRGGVMGHIFHLLILTTAAKFSRFWVHRSGLQLFFDF